MGKPNRDGGKKPPPRKPVDRPRNIRSLIIDLLAPPNQDAMGRCHHFTIRGYVAEARDHDRRKSWPLPDKTFKIGASLPAISVKNFRWWKCKWCLKDIIIADGSEPRDCELIYPIPNTGRTVTENNAGNIVAGNNNVEENRDVSRVRSQKDGHQKATTSPRRATPPRATNTPLATTTPPATTTPTSYNLRNRSRKDANPGQVVNKGKAKKPATGTSSSRKEKQNAGQPAAVTTVVPGQAAAVTTVVPGTIVNVAEDTVSPRAVENRESGRAVAVSDSGAESVDAETSDGRRTRKVRSLKQLLTKAVCEKGGGSGKGIEESSPKRESLRGRKRKTLPDNTSPKKPVRDVAGSGLRPFGRPGAGGLWLQPVFNTNSTTPPLQTSSSANVTALPKVTSGVDRKKKAVMGQEHGEAPRSGGQDRKVNTPEEMEIVELLAKNQYERCLPDDKIEDVSNQQEAVHKPKKRALMIDLNEPLENNEMELEENNETPPPPPPSDDSNARKQDHFPTGQQQQQQKSPEFVPVSQPYCPSIFATFPPTQEIPASSTMQWLRMQVMATQSPHQFRSLGGFDSTGQAIGHPVWPSPMHLQSHQRPASCLVNPAPTLNFLGSNGKQCGARSSSSSMDRYSNDSSIPAMNLLSLTDPRLKSQTPPDHQGNTMFTNSRRQYPPVSHQVREYTQLQTGESSRAAYPTQRQPTIRFGSQLAPIGTSFSFQNPHASWSQRQDTAVPVYNSQNNSVFASSDSNQFSGASSSVMPPSRANLADKRNNQKRKAETSNNDAVLPLPEPTECSVNRNPADFTVPGPDNEYMVASASLKVSKRATYKRKTTSSKQEEVKQTKKRAPGSKKA